MTETETEATHESPASRAGQGWCVPPTVGRFGQKLMAQQLWCWGKDVESPQGNLLMKYGFDRHRDRGDDLRSTCYRLDKSQLHVSLWGFGMFFGRREYGGLFLSRFDFTPCWAPIESLSLSIHWPDELPNFGRPQGPSQWQRARELWRSALCWIADYERWVLKTFGIAYRRDCVTTWLRPFVAADKNAAAWRFLGLRSWEKRSLPLAQTLHRYLIPTRSS